MHLRQGRVNQKLRTRNALIEVAAQLIRERRSFTVAEVADLAKVGRTTAYRYFPTLEELCAQGALFAVTKAEQLQLERMIDESGSYHDRLNRIVEIIDTSTTDHDAEYRAMLRMSLEDGPESREILPRRSGGRMDIIAGALDGLEGELGKAAFKRLCAALSMFVGIESAVVLRDVCLLSAEEARAVKRWGARAMLGAAVSEAVESKVNRTVPQKARGKRQSTGASSKQTSSTGRAAKA